MKRIPWIRIAIFGVVLLFLQVPAYYANTFGERKAPRKALIAKERSKWTCRHNAVGPMMVIPFLVPLHDTSLHAKKENNLTNFFNGESRIDAAVALPEKCGTCSLLCRPA